MASHVFQRRYLLFWAAVAFVFFVYINWFLYQPQGKEVTPPELEHWWEVWNPIWFSWPQAIVLLLPAFTYNLRAAKRLGGMRSHLGRAILFLTLGVVAWAGVGNLIFFAYQVSGTAVPPYPGPPDIGYIGLLPLYAVGLMALSRVVGIGRGEVTRLLWIPVITAAVVYFLTLPSGGVGPEWTLGSWSDVGNFTSIVSVLYLAVDLVLLPWAIILLVKASNVAGGLFHPPIAIVVVSLLCHVGADLLFQQRIAEGSYYTGDIASILYFASMFLMMYAVQRFASATDAMVAPKEVAR